MFYKNARIFCSAANLWQCLQNAIAPGMVADIVVCNANYTKKESYLAGTAFA